MGASDATPARLGRRPRRGARRGGRRLAPLPSRLALLEEGADALLEVLAQVAGEDEVLEAPGGLGASRRRVASLAAASVSGACWAISPASPRVRAASASAGCT